MMHQSILPFGFFFFDVQTSSLEADDVIFCPSGAELEQYPHKCGLGLGLLAAEEKLSRGFGPFSLACRVALFVFPYSSMAASLPSLRRRRRFGF